MDRDDEQKIYRTFEEFEREELRRDSYYYDTVDDVLEEMFAGELDFEPDPRRRRTRDEDGHEDADDEE